FLRIGDNSGNKRLLSVELLQRLNPGAGRDAHDPAEHFNESGRLAVSESISHLFDGSTTDEELDGLHQPHLTTPDLEIRAYLTLKSSLDGANAGTDRLAHHCHALALRGIAHNNIGDCPRALILRKSHAGWHGRGTLNLRNHQVA